MDIDNIINDINNNRDQILDIPDIKIFIVSNKPQIHVSIKLLKYIKRKYKCKKKDLERLVAILNDTIQIWFVFLESNKKEGNK